MDDQPVGRYLRRMSNSFGRVQLGEKGRATLRALVRVVVPHLFEDNRDGCGLADLVEERLRNAPPLILLRLWMSLAVASAVCW